MRSVRVIVVAAAVAVGISSVAQVRADDQMPANIVVAKDKAFEMPYFVWDPQSCKVKQRPVIDIQEKSTHGTLEAVPYTFEQNNAMRACFGRKMDAIKLVYTPEKGYTGPDHFKMRFGAYHADTAVDMGWTGFDVGVTVQ